MKILFRILLMASILVLSACGTATSSPPTAVVPNNGGSSPTATSPASASPTDTTSASAPAPTTPVQPTSNDLSLARQKIKHIVVIMQENRSFDEYFGTYPGANGIPMSNGVPTVCSPDPQTGQCVKPFHNPKLVNSGGPHASASATQDIAG